MEISVFNADDHPILRKGMTNLLIETDGIKWVGSAENGKEALEKIKALEPDVAILDIEMPFISGIEIIEQLVNEKIKTKFVLLTLFKDEIFFKNAMKKGAMGYMLKESKEDEVIKCIQSVYHGKPFVDSSLTHYLMDANRSSNSEINKLTEHEVNIVKLIAMEKTSKEIAEMLFISPKTVSNHRSNISKKLSLSGEQNGLLKWALQNKDKF